MYASYYTIVAYAICDMITMVLVCLWYDIIDITRLLHMIYVLWLVLHGNSSRAVAAIWLCTLCDRYSITLIFTCILMIFHDGYFRTHHRVSVRS